MRIKTLFALSVFCFAFWLASCSSVNPFSSKSRKAPTLYPIIQRNNDPGGKFGYINTKGEVVIQPQFSQAWFFSEGLAVACIESGKCGYIDETGKFVINPQFEFAGRFSEGLAAVIAEGKLAYVDKTGKFVISPQFQLRYRKELFLSIFSEGLAGVRISDKVGYVDKEGKIIINPQFDDGLPFMENLAAVRLGGKWGYIDKEGKIVVNPQFEKAYPFVNGLAGVKIGNQWGYIDTTGKIAINPQFDSVVPFADEGVALVFLKDKAGYIDKNGKYIVNPQYSVPNGPDGFHEDLVFSALFITSDLGKLSFSNGRALVNIGDSSPRGANFGYADNTGKIVINPQFPLAFPFYGDLALVLLNERTETFAWIDKEGKIVWREIKETPKSTPNPNANVSTSQQPTDSFGSDLARKVEDALVKKGFSEVSVDTTTEPATLRGTVPQGKMAEVVQIAQETAGKPFNNQLVESNSETPTEKTGRLTTDSNLREQANKDSASLGIHFKGARVTILDETSFTNDRGELATWYKVHVTEYGCSVNTNLGCGKNTPNDADEGWVNAKVILLD